MKTKLITLLTIVVTIIASIGWSATAQALDYPPDYSAATKTLYIDMARTGDGEAMYQLGLMHLHGLGAAQNENVARSFFTHAARTGHIKAVVELAALPTIMIAPKPAPVNSAAPIVKPIKAKPVTQAQRPHKEATPKKSKIPAATFEAQKAAKAKQAAQKKQTQLMAKQKAERQAALKAKRDKVMAEKRAAIQKTQKEKLAAKRMATNQAAAHKQALRKAKLDKGAKASDPSQSQSQEITKAKAENPMVPLTKASNTENAGDFAALLKGIITALLIILMLVAMVAMGRRIQR